MRKFCSLLILSSWLYLFFVCCDSGWSLQKGNSCGLMLTTVYGLDWPHKPATEADEKQAQQAILLDILTGFQEANLIMVFIQARRGRRMYRSHRTSQ